MLRPEYGPGTAMRVVEEESQGEVRKSQMVDSFRETSETNETNPRCNAIADGKEVILVFVGKT